MMKISVDFEPEHAWSLRDMNGLLLSENISQDDPYYDTNDFIYFQHNLYNDTNGLLPDVVFQDETNTNLDPDAVFAAGVTRNTSVQQTLCDVPPPSSQVALVSSADLNLNVFQIREAAVAALTSDLADDLVSSEDTATASPGMLLPSSLGRSSPETIPTGVASPPNFSVALQICQYEPRKTSKKPAQKQSKESKPQSGRQKKARGQSTRPDALQTDMVRFLCAGYQPSFN